MMILVLNMEMEHRQYMAVVQLCLENSGTLEMEKK